MSQPTPNNRFSLEKLPRPVIYGVPAALLIAGVGAWYFATSLGGPTAPVEPTTIQSTAPNTTPPNTATPTTTAPTPAPTAQVTPPTTAAPVSGATPVTPPAATPATSPTTAITTPNGTTPADTSTGPSRSLEVQPIPFLVTAAPKTSTKTPGAVAQASPNNRPRVSVNPFAPLNAQPAAPQATPTAQATAPAPSFNAPTQPNVFSPATSNLPPIRPAPSVQVSGTGQPLPSFPTQSNPGNTNRPSTPGTAAQMTTPKPNTVKPVPTAITTAKPQISAPVATPTRTDAPTPLTAGALPIAPSILREIVPQGPKDTGPNLTPINPATPEVPANIPVISTPSTPTQPSDLKPSPSDPATPTPLSSTTPTTSATPPAPPTPPATVATPTPTSTPLSSFILSNKVAFVGVIIGPVNTAILETKDGTVIVPLGGTIPQSDVIVKSVTATQVVLMLGQETVTIDRSKK